jgi:hypothetical protein
MWRPTRFARVEQDLSGSGCDGALDPWVALLSLGQHINAWLGTGVQQRKE